MKRTISLILAVVLCFGMLPVMASADYTVAQYSSTRSFLRYLDEKGIKYSWQGVNENNQEKVTVSYSDDNWGSVKFSIFFDSNCENAYFYIWNLCSYNETMFASLCQTLNSLNYKYRIARFYADTSDNSITVYYDTIFRSNDVGEINYEALYRMLDIACEAYDTLKPFIA